MTEAASQMQASLLIQDALSLKKDHLLTAEELEQLYRARADFSREHQDLLSERNSPVLTAVEAELLKALPTFDAQGKELSEAKRQRLLEEAKLASAEYQEALAKIRLARLELEQLDAQIAAIQTRFQAQRTAANLLATVLGGVADAGARWAH